MLWRIASCVSAVRQSSCTPPELPPVLTAVGGGGAHPPQIERTVRFPAETLQLVDKENAVRRKASSRVELWLKQGPSLLYRERKTRLQKLKRWSQKNKLSSWMISIGKKTRKLRSAVKAARKTSYEELNLKGWD